MGLIQSSTTVYAMAYLTELGRKYLFNNEDNKQRYILKSDGNYTDLLKIKKFTLGDPDVNYNIAVNLASGDVPDISGENENCITGAKGRELNCLICPKEADYGDVEQNKKTVWYQADNIVIDLKLPLTSLNAMYSTQLFTLIDDDEFVSDSNYNVYPKTYGGQVAKDGVLNIILKKATQSEIGYMMTIAFPPYKTAAEDMVYVYFSEIHMQPVDADNRYVDLTPNSTADNIIGR